MSAPSAFEERLTEHESETESPEEAAHNAPTVEAAIAHFDVDSAHQRVSPHDRKRPQRVRYAISASAHSYSLPSLRPAFHKFFRRSHGEVR